MVASRALGGRPSSPFHVLNNPSIFRPYLYKAAPPPPLRWPPRSRAPLATQHSNKLDAASPWLSLLTAIVSLYGSLPRFPSPKEPPFHQP